MTDHYDSFTVILSENIREDDAQAIIGAIRQLRGVLSVEPHISDGLSQSIGEMRTKTDLYDKITEIFWPEHLGNNHD